MIHLFRAEAYEATPWQLEIAVIVDYSSKSFLSIDDVTIDSVGCTEVASCDFERSECLWSNTHSIFWERGTIRDAEDLYNSNYEYAPHFDHTQQTPYGSYLYYNDNENVGTEELDRPDAGYLSETLMLTNRSCFEGWVHIQGEDPGKLTLKALYETGQSDLVLTFVMTPSFEWKFFHVPLKESPQQWVYFEAYGLKEASNVIALDDLKLYEGNCIEDSNSTQFYCDDQQKVSYDKVCDWMPDCSMDQDELVCGSCDFNQNSCGWRPVQTSEDSSEYYWVFKRRESDNYDDSGLMEVVNKDGVIRNIARMVTTIPLKPTYHTCTLYAQVLLNSGKDSCSLSFYSDHAGTDLTLLDQRSGVSPNKQLYTVHIGRIGSEFGLVVDHAQIYDYEFEAKILQIFMEDCELRSYDGDSCPENYNRCNNNQCVPKAALCDFTDDCGDYSDEMNCTESVRCSFESSDPCQFEVDNLSVVTGDISPYPPYRDHTLNQVTSHYILAEYSDSGSHVFGPLLEPTEGCELRLYYALAAEYSRVRLKIKVYSEGGSKIVAEKTISSVFKEEYYWHRTSLTFSSTAKTQVSHF